MTTSQEPELDRLAQMLRLQLKLQVESYGCTPNHMQPSERTQYIKDMVLAAVSELFEALDETPWKPWVTGARGVNVDTFVGELVDVWHFLMNLLLAAGYEPEAAADALYDGYLAKRRVNVQRQRDDYDGVSTKCVVCGRALDDPAVMCLAPSGGLRGKCMSDPDHPTPVYQRST